MATASSENGEKCCLKSCEMGGTIQSTESRADVRGYSTRSLPEFMAHWGDDGVATFHLDCWNLLVEKADSSDISTEEKELIGEAENTAEYHQSEEYLKEAAARIATMIKECSYPIAFTGAGISTSAGIGDFRGIHGKWTNRDKEKDYGAQKTSTKKPMAKSKTGLRPTYTHEALLKLLELGHLKYIISQNTDGLHRLSGIPEDKISELHGNAFMEKCEKCEKRYVLNWNFRNSPKNGNVPPKKCPDCRINHRTGRVCPNPKCNGYLMNTIINFGDSLESQVLDSAIDHAKKADVVLVLGSTLRVSPANSLVEMGHQPNRLVICNRQTTPYDNLCEMKNPKTKAQLGCRVFGDCDDLMREVMLHILGQGQVEEWENGREERMKAYNKQRQ